MPFIEYYNNKSYSEQESCSGYSTKNFTSKMIERQQESQERAERAIREAEVRRAKEDFPRIFEH